MKRLLLSAAIILVLAYGVKAQKINQLLVQFSFNQVELGYQHKLLSEKTWGEAFAGTGNQDINRRFDDLVAGLRMGHNAISNEKNLLGLYTSFGTYIPNNDYYTAATPVIGAGIRYTRLIGKSGRHALIANTGGQYGKRDYRQEYSSEIIGVTTVGTFKIAPFSFSLGYGYKF